MIAVSLCGGLGNQMLQYAAGIRLARKHQTTLHFDLAWYSDCGGVTPRNFGLDAFGVTMDSWSGIGLTPIVERGLGFDPSILDLLDNSWLQGYWFSERYFADEAEAVREAYTFPDLPPEQARLAERIGEDSVAVFVRRSDYVTDEGMNRTLGVLPLDYYWRAANRMVERLSSPRFLVFSDDPAWCEEQFPEWQVVPHDEEAHACHDMHLASLCRHQIIANSTYGWWAAWLNRNPGKVIIAPAQFFANSMLDTTDVIPEGWERI